MDIATFRRLIDDAVAPYTYTDAQITTLLEENEAEVAASAIWREKAARYASLVNVSESGSSRSMGDLYKNALDMVRYYDSKASVSVAAVAENRPRTRAIVRP